MLPLREPGDEWKVTRMQTTPTGGLENLVAALAAVVLSNPSTRHIWAGLITHVLTQSGLDLVIFMLCVKCNCSKNLYKSHII